MWHKCENEQDVKDLFKKLALRLHPDQGGSHELMILLQESYEFMKEKPKCFKELMEFSNLLRKKPQQKVNKYEKSLDDVNVGDERLMIVQDIYAYAEENESFDTSFLESVCEFANKKGYMTSGQFNALVNLFYSFKMYEKDEE